MIASTPSIDLVESKVGLKSFSKLLTNSLSFISLEDNAQWYFGTIRSINDHFVNITPTISETEKGVMIRRKSAKFDLSFTGFAICELTAHVKLNETEPGFIIELSLQKNSLKVGASVIFSLKEDKQGKTVIENFILFDLATLTDRINRILKDREVLCTLEYYKDNINRVKYHFDPDMEVLLVDQNHKSPTLSQLPNKNEQKEGTFHKFMNTYIQARDIVFGYDDGLISNMELQVPSDFKDLFQVYIRDLI